VIAGGGGGVSRLTEALAVAGGYRCSITGESSGGGALLNPYTLPNSVYRNCWCRGPLVTQQPHGVTVSNSVFSTITSTGGGAGGIVQMQLGPRRNRVAGGSGGGRIASRTVNWWRRNSTTSQGYAGGVGRSSGKPNRWWRWRRGSAGADSGTLTNGGNGGSGVASSITGSSSPERVAVAAVLALDYLGWNRLVLEAVEMQEDSGANGTVELQTRVVAVAARMIGTSGAMAALAWSSLKPPIP
jgi:hypothetical protein